MWLMARNFIETCDRLFIIGYSLPVSDTYVNLFLSKSLRSHTEVILVNNDDSDEFSSRLSNQLAGRVDRGASFLGDRSVDRFIDWLAP
jgi:NAD-dependent SIR2 family protein deacetylase